MCKKNRLARFIVIRPETPEGKQTLNLIRDADGILVEGNALGIVVQVKAHVGHDLKLPEIIHLDEVVEIVRG
jgi:hypothetical protein